MSESGMFPLFCFTLLLEVTCITLTLVSRWEKKEKVEDADEDAKTWFKKHEELHFVTDMWQKPEVCYHIGKCSALLSP